jgi:hypothetical protein
MAKINFSHEITERRDHGRVVVNQEMVITVDFEPSNDSFEVEEVNLFQDGKHIAEISKLLDKAEGNPLQSILEAIDWAQVYAESMEPSELENQRS